MFWTSRKIRALGSRKFSSLSTGHMKGADSVFLSTARNCYSFCGLDATKGQKQGVF